MNNIISVESITDCENYNPILMFNEDFDFDNRFCVLNTDVGNIVFSYYDLGVAPSYIIHDAMLFLCFGKSYYIVNLKENNVVYQTNDSLSVIYEIVKSDKQSCIVFIGEMSLICFGMKGERIWENHYKNVIFDWDVVDEGITVLFENNKKWLVLFENGNGFPVM